MSMRIGALLSSAAGIMVGLASVAVPDNRSSARAEEPQKHEAGEKHGDMFRSTDKPRTIVIDDPRLKVNRVRYTPEKRAVALEDGEPGENLVIIEGDILLGTEEELEQKAAIRLALQAQALNPDDPDLGLDDTQKQTLRQLRALALQDNSAVARAAKKAQVAEVLREAVSLGIRAIGEKTRSLAARPSVACKPPQRMTSSTVIGTQ